MIVLDGELRMREPAINLGVLEASHQLPSHLEPDPSALGPKLPISTWKELTDSPRLVSFTPGLGVLPCGWAWYSC